MKTGFATLLTLMFVMLLAYPAYAESPGTVAMASPSAMTGMVSPHGSAVGFIPSAHPSIPSPSLPVRIAAAYNLPVFTVVSVLTDQNVTIATMDLSPNDHLRVLMANYGTQGIGGIEVGTIDSGSGGVHTATFTIPTPLQGSYQIAIRLESTNSGLAYPESFFNNTNGVLSPGASSTATTSTFFSVVSVVRDSSVTLQIDQAPANDAFDVFMGDVKVQGMNETKAGTIFTGNGGQLYQTIPIPANLHGVYQISLRLESPYSGYYSYQLFNNNTTAAYGAYYTSLPHGVVPTISIISVVQNSTVTIQTANFPANDTFYVRMGAMGTAGINGTYVGTLNSGSGGTFQATLAIPSNLVGSYQIAIRLESPYSGYYSYNWFYNNTNNYPYPNPNPYPYPGLTPTFSIVSVVKDSTVTIQTANFPVNDTFNVRMGPMGTAGINGTYVGTLNSGSGGVFQATFNIPPNLIGSYQIAVRLESPTSGYYSYNWFYNNTANSNVVPSPVVVPTFSIASVVKNGTVTIQTANFPASDTFNVRMGPMGTAGINGTLVGTLNSGSGGSFTATFNIPASLVGSYQIAIRLESPISGYYSYNWFYNNNAP